MSQVSPAKRGKKKNPDRQLQEQRFPTKTDFALLVEGNSVGGETK